MLNKFEQNTNDNLHVLKTYNLLGKERFPEETIPALATLINWQTKGEYKPSSLGYLVLEGENRIANLRDYFSRKVKAQQDKDTIDKLSKEFPSLYQLDKLNHKDNRFRIQGLTPIQWLQLLDYTVNIFIQLQTSLERTEDLDINNIFTLNEERKEEDKLTKKDKIAKDAGINQPEFLDILSVPDFMSESYLAYPDEYPNEF